MIHSALAVKYAKGLFEASRETNSLEEVRRSLINISKAVEGDERIIEVLKSPILPFSKKIEFIRSLKDTLEIHPLIFNLLCILAEKRRVYLLKSIITLFNELYLESKGIKVLYVRTAKELNEEERVKLEGRLKSVFGGEIELQIEVDPSLIGGVVFKYKDFIIDGSIRRFLFEIKDKFTSL